MIGDTLTVTYDGVANVLTKINQDNYSSEYLKRDAVHELRVRVRHSNESPRPGARPFERHQFELTRTVFDSVNGDKVYQAYTVIRFQKSTDPEVAEKTASALCGTLSAAMIDKVANWES